MGTPTPKIKDHPAIPPELKKALIMPKQANSVAADVTTLVADFNALLTKLRATGLLDS